MRAIVILEQLRELVDSLSPGDRLPAERDLSRHLGCSRQTVRAGLSVLQREQIIWRHVGQGTFVGTRPRHLPMQPVREADVSPTDLLRARLLLEPTIAAEAARCATPADVENLQRLIALGQRALRVPDCEQADSDFHQGLGQITGNPVLMTVMGGLSGVRRHSGWQRSWDRSYRRLAASTFQTEHSDQHQRIAEAIAAGDEAGASQAMTQHLQAIQAAFQEEVR
jgi:DNA-binding FadR family transcriptional regulator